MKKKIVLYQSSPRIRLYKYSKLFFNMGYEVSCFYVDKDFSLNYSDLDLSHFKEIKKLNNLNDFLIFDYIFVIDLICIRGIIQKLINLKNIYFLVGDVWMLRNIQYFNGKLQIKSINNSGKNELQIIKYIYDNNKIKNIIFTGKYLRDSIKNLFNLHYLDNCLYIPNSHILEWKENLKFKKKLSENDNKIHIVYPGGMTRKHENHLRNFNLIFDKLSKNEDIVIHVYPTDWCGNDYIKKKNIIFENRCPIHLLIEELTQYDFGLMFYNTEAINFNYVRICEPNKLYDFCEAKLPIICNNVLPFKEIVEKNKIGLCFNKIEDITKKKLSEMKLNYNYNYSFTSYDDYKNDIKKILKVN